MAKRDAAAGPVLVALDEYFVAAAVVAEPTAQERLLGAVPVLRPPVLSPAERGGWTRDEPPPGLVARLKRREYWTWRRIVATGMSLGLIGAVVWVQSIPIPSPSIGN
jgi:hypothetical protein